MDPLAALGLMQALFIIHLQVRSLDQRGLSELLTIINGALGRCSNSNKIGFSYRIKLNGDSHKKLSANKASNQVKKKEENAKFHHHLHLMMTIKVLRPLLRKKSSNKNLSQNRLLYLLLMENRLAHNLLNQVLAFCRITTIRNSSKYR